MPESTQPATEYDGAQAAYEALEPTLKSIPEGALGPFRAAVPFAVTAAMQVAAAFAEDRPRLAACFVKEAFDPAQFDDIRRRALALWQADVNYRLAVDPEGVLAPLVDEATTLRRGLLSAAEYLWTDDPEIAPKLAAIRQGRGHLDIADDLLALATLFTERWPRAEGQSRVRPADVARARALSEAITAALLPADATTAVTERRQMRDRAGHHLSTAVAEVRAAAAWLHRAAPDQLTRYPSLFAAPRRSSRPSAPEPPAEPEPTSPV